MDSITQFVLGAAIGEALLGKKVGNKAILWGGIAGTIPDLDVLLNPFISTYDELSTHRGFSHSLVFPFLMAPVLAAAAIRLQKKSQASFSDWFRLFFWAIITHPLLDSLTNYGTQLFLPFSRYRVALNTISIVDPLYTLPMLFALLACLFYKRISPARFKINRVGMIIAHSYLLLTLVNKINVNARFRGDLDRQSIAYTHMTSNPTLFSNILWYAVARSDSGHYMSYYSLFDQEDKLHWKFIPQHRELVRDKENDPALLKLNWFSNGYYALEQGENKLYYHDLRFGSLDLGQEGRNYRHVFRFELSEKKGAFELTQEDPPGRDNFAGYFPALWRRMMGDREPFKD